MKSADLGNGSVSSPRILDQGVKSIDIANNGVGTEDVRDDTLAGGGLNAADLSPDSVGTSEVDGSLTGADIDESTFSTSPSAPAGSANGRCSVTAKVARVGSAPSSSSSPPRHPDRATGGREDRGAARARRAVAHRRSEPYRPAG